MVAAESPTPWRTGAAFQQQLGTSIDIVWSENPIRGALRGLSRSQRVAIVLDRRVNPDQQLEIKLASVPLAAALQKIAENRGLGAALLGSVVYIGPPQAATRIRSLAAQRDEEVRQLHSLAAGRLLHCKRMAWDDFATPRDLLSRLAEEGGITLEGMEQVPHDLWAAGDLPALSWVDRVTLVAIQFDLTFRVAADGRLIQLVSVPQDNLSPQLAKNGLDVPAVAPGGKIGISHLAVQNKPVGAVLEQLAAKLKFELHIDRKALQEAGISLDQRVSIQVENASVDDVLRELLRTTPLGFRHRGTVVEILPK